MTIDPDALLARILAWANADPNVLVVILTGSRARIGATPDEFSDHDLEIIARDPTPLIDDDAWWRAFGHASVHLSLSDGQPYPTRLIFYEGGRKVDFSLCRVDRVRDMIDARTLNDMYERGYTVLIDKENITAGLPAAIGNVTPKPLPDQRAFSAVVSEFWFEAAHIPRYVIRGELWVVKFRAWTMQRLLLRMLEWRAIALSEKSVDVWQIGTHMHDWIDAGTRAQMGGTFSAFTAGACWQDLLATTALFRRIANETATATALNYPQEIDADITAYIATFTSRIPDE
jgi:aminoglycoside 6-adenylyltransferase